MSIVRAKVPSYVESVCDLFNKNIRSQKLCVNHTNIDTNNPLKNYINLLIVNTYADDYYGSTTQKWKGLILPERSVTEDACHASILAAGTGGKQDLLKLLDIRVFQISTGGNTTE